jgi:hypothetical protein
VQEELKVVGARVLGIAHHVLPYALVGVLFWELPFPAAAVLTYFIMQLGVAKLQVRALETRLARARTLLGDALIKIQKLETRPRPRSELN